MCFDTLKFSLSFLIFSLASRFYAGSRPAASHSVRSTQSEEQPNSLNRCALWPVPPWTTLRPVDGGDNAARCPLPAHRPPTRCPPLHCTGGHAPRNPPPRIRTAQLLKKIPSNSQTAGQPCAASPCLPPGRHTAGTRGREATGGAALGGRGGVAPPVRERPRRGA